MNAPRAAFVAAFAFVAALSLDPGAHAAPRPDTPNSTIADHHPQAQHNARVAEWLLFRHAPVGHNANIAEFVHR